MIESGSGDDIDIIADDDLVLEALGDDVLIDADDDIKLNAGNDGSGKIVVYDPIESPSGDNVILDSGNDIELITTDGDYVEIWKKDGTNTPQFMYTLPNTKGTVGQFLQRSADGSSEFYSDWSAYALPTLDGTAGQILTTDGSGTVSWGASALNDLSDARTYGINSITIGHTTTGQLFSANYNVAVGVNSLMSITQGTNNTAIGDGSVKLLTTGKHNVAVGKDALNNLSTSSYNTAVGYQALTGLKSGGNNIAIGDNAGGIITQVSNNIFIGEGPFASGLTDSNGDGEKTLGDDNIYIGNNVNPKQENVSNEIVIGADATGSGTNTITLGHTTNTAVHLRGDVKLEETPKLWIGPSSGNDNDVLTVQSDGTVAWEQPAGGGASALNDLTDASTYGFALSSLSLGQAMSSSLTGADYNLGVGKGSNSSLTTGDRNTAIGYMALTSNEVGTFNIAIGMDAAYNLAGTGASQQGNSNIAIGYAALKATTSTAEAIAIGKDAMGLGVLTGGYGNVAIGTKAASKLAGATGAITAIGYEALENTTGGGNSTAVGFQALMNNIDGHSNDALGYQSLYNNTTGDFNTSVGRQSSFSLSSGDRNTSLGYAAGYSTTAASKSVFIGATAGSFAGQLGTRNIYIGAESKVSGANVNDEIVIGANATGNGTNTITLGHTTNTAVYARGTVYSNAVQLTSDSRLKKNIVELNNSIDVIKALRPVEYDKKRFLEAETYDIHEFGFIAQELQNVIPQIVEEGTDKDKTLSVNYISLISVMTKAMQEQQTQIEKQNDLINNLIERLEKLEQNEK